MKLRAPLFVLASSMAFPAMATHIIGGELYYDHLGGDDYEVTLKLFRDCGPNNTNGTGFDATAEIGVFDALGNYLFSEFFTFPGAISVPVTLGNPCLTVPPTICVEQATYSGVIELPGGAGAYTLAYQRCCRTPIIINLAIPDQEGLTCTVQVPDVTVTPNSSPRFSSYPPIVMCVGENMVFDHSATDPDGDQLVYELCTPFNGGDQFNPLPSPPFPPPYVGVTWAPGYSAAFPMDAAPGMAIDAVTGELTATPTLAGSYVVGVLVKEFRGGVLLSEVRRDVRLDVVPCLVNVVSAIQPQGPLCTGLTIDFPNQSTGGAFWWWDFGDPLTSADTSSLFEPTYTFLDSGLYTVTLIANPGWPCADTSTIVYDVHEPLDPVFVPPAITCMDRQPVSVLATGNFTSGADVLWDLGPFGTTPTVPGNPGQLSFTQPGTNTITVHVEQFGCEGEYTDTVTVYPNPVAIFDGDTAGCTPLDVRFTDLSTAWTPLSWKWDFGDGGGSIDQHPQHLYTTSGSFDVRLEVKTSSGCIDTVAAFEPDFVQAWVQPVAGFTVTPHTVNVLEPTILVTDASTDAVQWTYWIVDTTITDPTFLYDMPDAGEYTITQVVSTSQLCSDTLTRTVIVRDHLFYAPNAFSPDGDGVNEEFLPMVVGAREYALQVYDRWGEQVFSTNDKAQGWSGAGFPNDVYVFHALVVTYGSARKEYTGHVTLVR